MDAMRTCRGFTLVELVMVILVVTIAATGLITALSRLGEATLMSERAQTAAELVQSCAEHLLAARRNRGVAAMDTNCGAVPGFSGSVVLTTPFVDPVCPEPTGILCRRFRITATVPSGHSSTMDLLIVNYL